MGWLPGALAVGRAGGARWGERRRVSRTTAVPPRAAAAALPFDSPAPVTQAARGAAQIAAGRKSSRGSGGKSRYRRCWRARPRQVGPEQSRAAGCALIRCRVLLPRPRETEALRREAMETARLRASGNWATCARGTERGQVRLALLCARGHGGVALLCWKRGGPAAPAAPAPPPAALPVGRRGTAAAPAPCEGHAASRPGAVLPNPPLCRGEGCGETPKSPSREGLAAPFVVCRETPAQRAVKLSGCVKSGSAGQLSRMTTLNI